jgi:hypothetical protein
MQTIWLKHNRECLEGPSQMHFKAAIGLRAYNYHLRGLYRSQLVGVEHLGWIAEFKNDHRSRAGGNGVRYKGSAIADLALDVEANELAEAWRRFRELATKHGPAPFSACV